MRLYVSSTRIRTVVGGRSVAEGCFPSEAFGKGFGADLRMLSTIAEYEL